MKHDLGIILAFLFAPALAACQSNNNCRLIEEIYSNDIQIAYNTTYITDSLVPFYIGNERSFLSYFSKSVPLKVLKKALASNDEIKWEDSYPACFSALLTYDKDSILREVREIDVSKFIADSPFVKYVDQRHFEIVQLTDEQRKQEELNNLMITAEFKRYTAALNFFTPRVLEFSKPVCIAKFCFLRVNVLKNHSDDRYAIIYVFNKEGVEWRLLDKWKVIE